LGLRLGTGAGCSHNVLTSTMAAMRPPGCRQSRPERLRHRRDLSVARIWLDRDRPGCLDLDRRLPQSARAPVSVWRSRQGL
jgi:hypothetical protein